MFFRYPYPRASERDDVRREFGHAVDGEKGGWHDEREIPRDQPEVRSYDDRLDLGESRRKQRRRQQQQRRRKRSLLEAVTNRYFRVRGDRATAVITVDPLAPTHTAYRARYRYLRRGNRGQGRLGDHDALRGRCTIVRI